MIAAQNHLFAPRIVAGCEVGGATAVGMRNPNAMTNAVEQFRSSIKNLDRKTILVMQLGEVDCGYVIWYRAKKYNETVELQMEQSINSYTNFVEELLDLGFQRIIITSATLPTITDTDQDGEVIKRRSGISATQDQRTKLTHEYNLRLKKMCEVRGLLYADATPYVIDEETQLVKQALRNRNPLDHHMDYGSAASIWASVLNKALALYDKLPTKVSKMRAVRSTCIKGLAWEDVDLPDHLKIKVCAGDVLCGEIDAEFEEYILISHAKLNDAPLDTMMRIIIRRDWAYDIF